MSRHGIPIGRIFGIAIDLDYSWFLIFGLITWILAVSYYPAEFRNWSDGEYWAMGAVTAILLFVSVLIHELAHSLVATRYGIPVPRITLFLFGGVSQIASEPPSPSTEFWIAIVGPLTSLAVAAFCWEIEPLTVNMPPLFALAEYLAAINLILAIFNLIPGFPLDGGRIFRALWWRVSNNYHRATTAAAFSGRFFGFLLIFFGLWHLLTGDISGGIWIAFIGWFLESAAGTQLKQETLKNVFNGHKVADAMQRSFPQFPASATIEQLAEQTGLPSNGRPVIVTSPGGAIGLVTLPAVRSVPHEAWSSTLAAQIMAPFGKLDTTEPGAVLWSALEKMGRDGVNQLAVVEGNGVVGILSREDILHYLNVLQASHTVKAANSK